MLLGMGIGIILTALLGFIFFLGYKPEMDETNVKELAKKYGMVDPEELPRQYAFEKLTVEVAEGDTLKDITNQLVDVGLVGEPVTFQIKLVNQQVGEKIIPGIYVFSGNETEQEIIDILTEK